MALVFALAPLSVGGKTVNDLKKQQEQAQQQAKDAQGALSDTNAKISEARTEVEQLDEELAGVMAEYDATAANLSETEARLAQAEKDLDAAQIRREAQFEALRARVRFMYENGRLGYFEALFNSGGFAEFINNAQYISQIVEKDSDALNDLREAERTVAETIEEIAAKKVEVSVLKKQLEGKRAALETALEAKRDAVNALDADAKKYAQQVQDLEADSKAIEKLIKQKEAEEAKRKAAEAAAKKAAANVEKFNGTLLWPAPSTTVITSGYGYRINPISGKKEFHTGVDIGLAYGANIVAAEKGTVIMSKYNGGYGYCIIISHGGGLSTLYGHCSKLLVSEGDTVTRGQTIAKCGSTGYSTGPHLHFETRVNGNHTSPKNYLNY